ncbi:MAG: Tol-Pal system protein TolB, partial [Xanthomonadales bacterium]|nr:Tol-Pal system protein TolB [Xanthomonadales bacterium]
MRNRTLIRFGLLLLLFAGANGAWAQGLTIEINDGSRTADPIAVVPFAFEGAGLPPETDVSEIVRADLARSGKFFTLARRDIVEFPTRESEVKFATWRLLKQNYLVVGRIADAG